VRERKSREFDPTTQMLQRLVADPDLAREDHQVRRRIEQTLALMTALSSWGEEMLKLDPATMHKVLKLGGKIQKLLFAENKGKPT